LFYPRLAGRLTTVIQQALVLGLDWLALIGLALIGTLLLWTLMSVVVRLVLS
jgi:hypothetical protein